MRTFEEIVTEARSLSGLTSAEFDYSIAFLPGGWAWGAIDNALYRLSNEGLPQVGSTTTAEDLTQRRTNADALRQRHQEQLDALTGAARTKKYLGWSDAARASGHKIRYASDHDEDHQVDQER